MAKMKRKIRRFADGGELSLDGLSLSEARNVARNMVEMSGDPSLKHFTWRGQKYAISQPRSRPAPKVDEAPARTSAPQPRAAREDYFGPSTMTQQLRSAASESPNAPRQSMRAPDMISQRALDRATADALARASMGPIAAAGSEGAMGAAAGALKGVRAARNAGMLEDEASDMVARAAAKKAAARKSAEDVARKVEAASDRRTRNFAEQLRQEGNRKRVVEYPGVIDWRRAPSDADMSGVISGYKKGGKVQKFAKGGSIRGAGIERKGKTKGRFV